MPNLDRLNRDAAFAAAGHGGLTASTVARTTFTAGLVWAEQRIGAMRGATAG